MDPVAKRPVIGHRANALGRDGAAERDAASRENGQSSEPAGTIRTRLLAKPWWRSAGRGLSDANFWKTTGQRR
jgi:hypothetical protein